MQGGRLTSPAKSDWISIFWTGLSLLQEQGGYYSLAGRINSTIASIGVHAGARAPLRRCCRQALAGLLAQGRHSRRDRPDLRRSRQRAPRGARCGVDGCALVPTLVPPRWRPTARSPEHAGLGHRHGGVNGAAYVAWRSSCPGQSKMSH